MTKFMETVSTKIVFLTARRYLFPYIGSIIRAWNMNRPQMKADTYSIRRSKPLASPNPDTTTAEMITPVASPARQCISLLSPCFQVDFVYASCMPGPGLRHESMYMKSPIGPV